MLKLIIILTTISASSKAVCDALRFRPASFPFQSDWWLAKGDYAWDSRTFLEQYFFSFVSEGWHCFDAIRITSMILLVSLLITDRYKIKTVKEIAHINEYKIDNNVWLFITGIVFLLYVYHGLIFEITYWIL